jgi:hypothetical protein
MSIPVAVTLTISTTVDTEYPANDHIHDIVANAKSMFCACDVKVVDVQVGELDDTHSLTTERSLAS